MRAHGTRSRPSDERDTTIRRVAAPSAPVQRMLTLQRLAGNAAVARSVEADRHEHGPGCGHGGAQDTSPAAQRSLLDAAKNTPSSPLPGPFLAKAKSFYQNDNLSAGRVHDNLTAQRATAALGAEAMTVGSDVFLGPSAIGNTKILAHEASHLDKNLRGIRETGNDHGAGMTVTDPGQGSERAAETDSDAFMAGAGTAPSVVAQRSVTEHAAETDQAVQRSTVGGEGAADRGQGAVVQRAGDRKRGPADESVDEAVAVIADPHGRQENYDEAGMGKRIPKSDVQVACWEWAVRAAATSGGLDRGQYWAYLSGWSDAGEVAGLDELEPAVKSELDQLKNEMTAAGLSSGHLNQDRDEALIRPYMQRSVENFVKAHGFQIQRDEPAGWVVCHYKMTGTAGFPEHFWIELPSPGGGGRVMIQTVPGMDHYEAGGTDLRMNDANSVEGRRDNSEQYVTLEVPVAALKGRHTEILNSLVRRTTRSRRG